MNKTFFLPLIIVFFAIYYFLFPREGGAEITLIPDEAWSLSSSRLPDEKLLISRGEQKALFNPDGSLSFLPVPRKNSVLTESLYFYREGSGFILKDLKTGETSFISGNGEALILNSRIYVVDLWKGRIQEYDARGGRLWSWQGLGPVTALDAGETGTVLGLLDGSVQLFDSNGIRRVINPPEGVQDCIIYGLSMAPGGKRLSVLSGLKQPRIREYDLETLAALGEDRMLNSRFSRPVKMSYSSDGNTLWVEQKDKVVQFGPDNKSFEIAQEGQLLALGSIESDGQLMILSESRRKNSASEYLMNFYSMEGALISSMKFSSFPDDVVIQNGEVFFSVDGRILKMTRRES